jgi:hypothetical protein
MTRLLVIDSLPSLRIVVDKKMLSSIATDSTSSASIVFIAQKVETCLAEYPSPDQRSLLLIAQRPLSR